MARYEARQRAFAKAKGIEHLGAVGLVELRRFGFELHAHADYELVVVAGSGRAPMSSRPHRADHRLDVGELIFTDVDDSHHRLVGQEEIRLEQHALIVGEAAPIDRRARREQLDRSLERRHFVRDRLVALCRLAPLVELPFGRIEIGERQLDLEHRQRIERVGGTGHIGVGVRTEHVDDRVGLSDAGEKTVAETLTLVRPFDQTPDIGELNGGRHDIARLGHRGEFVEAVIGHSRHTDIGIDSGERVGRSQRAAARQRVVQRRLACIGQADESEAFHEGARLPAANLNSVQEPRARANAALLQAIYYLDRELAPSTKVRAFIRALGTVDALSDDELVERTDNQTLTELEGIGPSTGEVIADAVAQRPSSYLAKLEARSRIPIGAGEEIRSAIRGDCHLHSMWSDGAAPVAAMADAARALGHDYMVLTDHSARLTVAHGLDEARVRRQLDEIAAVNAQMAPFRVLSGLEVDILEDGSLDLADDLLAELDVVVGSVHSKFRMPREDMTRRLVMAIASPHVDMIGHITNRKVAGGGRDGSVFDAEIVFAACARFDTAIEINCRPERQDPPEDLVSLARQWDLKFCINTDAHAPGQLEWQPYGCDKLAQLDIGPDSVINTWSADELVGWASSR